MSSATVPPPIARLVVERVTKGFAPGDPPAVRDVSLGVAAGEVLALVGPSGSGKTTLLRLVAGFEAPDEGRIAIDGRPVQEGPRALVPVERRGVGVVFQHLALFPHLDVAANVGFGIAHLPAAVRRDRVAQLLDQFHVGHLAASYPHMLSGGEQQRVAIARAMARAPALLLLDEPFSGLDGDLRERVRDALLADLRASGATVLVVTHDPAEAMLMADDLLLMAGGHILQCGSPADCYRNPVSLTAARLLGEVVTLPGRLAGGMIETPLGHFEAPGLGDGQGLAVLRPHHLQIATRDGTQACVVGARFAGGCWHVTAEVAGHRLPLRLTGEAPPEGAMLRVTVDASAVRVFADHRQSA